MTVLIAALIQISGLEIAGLVALVIFVGVSAYWEEITDALWPSRKQKRDEKAKQLWTAVAGRVTGALAAKLRTVDVFQTSKGSVTVAWAVAPSIESAAGAFTDSGAALDSKKRAIVAKLGEILKANPDADLNRYRKSLGIFIESVERTWDSTPPSPVGQFAATAKKARTVVDLELARASFIADNKELLDRRPELLDDVHTIFDAERHRIVVPDDMERQWGNR